MSPGDEGIYRVKRELSPDVEELGGQPAEYLIVGTGVSSENAAISRTKPDRPELGLVADGHLR